jgi:hypothetical protein
MQATTNERSNTADTLFRHVSRPDWGLAILLWDSDDKRGFQFQDGQLRIFTSRFYDLLETVDRPMDESARVLAELGRVAGRQRASKRIGADSPPIALVDQVAYFSSLFPEGFQGAKWSKQHRGAGARTHLKRHRDKVMHDAAKLLTPERLRAHLEGELPDVIIGDLRALVDSTDLVSKTAARGMDRIGGTAAQSLVRTLADLLTDGSDVAATFEAWTASLARVLGRKPSWELATAFAALARPDRFTAVKRTTFMRAAAWLAPSLVVDDTPSGHVYERLLDMVDTLTAKLGEAGLRPRDRLDVYDFVQLTLCPKAVKQLAAKPEDDSSDAPADGEQAPAHAAA